jgi:polyribonucleotide nucleotidyltransferase
MKSFGQLVTGPPGAVRVSFCNNKIVINPTGREQSQSILKLVVSAACHHLF